MVKKLLLTGLAALIMGFSSCGGEESSDGCNSNKQCKGARVCYIAPGNAYGECLTPEEVPEENTPITSLCQQLCAQPDCAADLELSGSNCVNDCVNLASNYSQNYLAGVKDCFDNYSCDGENSWIYCLQSIDEITPKKDIVIFEEDIQEEVKPTPTCNLLLQNCGADEGCYHWPTVSGSEGTAICLEAGSKKMGEDCNSYIPNDCSSGFVCPYFDCRKLCNPSGNECGQGEECVEVYPPYEGGICVDE